MALGCAYFGNRILRHAAADMADLAARGFTGVLHTFSENDLAHYRTQIARLAQASHDVGLEVQLSPWGLGGVFGGEAESAWVAAHPQRCQVLDDGTPVGAACLLDPRFRTFVAEWVDAAVTAGADRVFLDEPQWADAARHGREAQRWGCRCPRCRQAYAEWAGRPMPAALTDDVVAFRESVLVGFVRETVGQVAARGGRATVCLLPGGDGPGGVRDWRQVAGVPGLDTFATTPYWKVFGRAVEPFVGECAAAARAVADEHAVTAQVWLQGFGLGPEDRADLHAAAHSVREAGVTDVWTWAYEAGGHMSSLGTRDAAAVWEELCVAVTGRAGPVRR